MFTNMDEDERNRIPANVHAMLGIIAPRASESAVSSRPTTGHDCQGKDELFVVKH